MREGPERDPIRFFNDGIELIEVRTTPQRRAHPMRRVHPEELVQSRHPIDEQTFEATLRESLARYRRHRARREGGFLTPSPEKRWCKAPRQDDLTSRRHAPSQMTQLSIVTWQPVAYYRPRAGGGGISAREYQRAHWASIHGGQFRQPGLYFQYGRQ